MHTDSHDISEDNLTASLQCGLWHYGTSCGVFYRYLFRAPSYSNFGIASRLTLRARSTLSTRTFMTSTKKSAVFLITEAVGGIIWLVEYFVMNWMLPHPRPVLLLLLGQPSKRHINPTYTDHHDIHEDHRNSSHFGGFWRDASNSGMFYRDLYYVPFGSGIHVASRLPIREQPEQHVIPFTRTRTTSMKINVLLLILVVVGLIVRMVVCFLGI